jgi:hypothetical protein
VHVAFPGEHWSNRIAKGAIQPGDAIIETNYGGKLAMQRAATADDPRRLAIALRTVDIPDTNLGSLYGPAFGPNEIVNMPIADGQYVHAWYSGVFVLSVATPRVWLPGDLVGWNATAARPAGKTGTGAWVLAADMTAAWGTVQEFRPFSANGQEGLLTVRSLRTQS